ncbi:hypothetical protein FO519_000293 [Halicephalobus sp. NKZ332]|nr:hypothetical protein FO519_000293 [Halicephalobus sp. NKZ332]
MSETSTRRIWNPAIDENAVQEKEDRIISESDGKVANSPIQTPFPPMPLPMFPFGNLFPRFPPFLMPPINPAVLALCAKSMQQQSQQKVHSTKRSTTVRPQQDSKEQSVATKNVAPNPIVNAILSDSPSASDIRSINHNVCAICGESFRLTGDLVHHMRRERCRNSSMAPYQIPKSKKKK